MGEPVEQGCRHLGIAEHLVMPQSLIDESLRSGWLIRITPCTGNAFGSATGDRAAGMS